MNRLSPYNVDHPLIRASLYREVMTPDANALDYEVSLDELNKPELIAHRLDNTAHTKLFVAVCGEMISLRDELSPAQILSLKRTSVIRESIRKYQDIEQALGRLNNDF